MSFRSSNMEIGREGCSSSAQNALPLPEKCYPIIPGTPMKTDQVRIHWMESGDYNGSDGCLHETKRRKEESGSRSAAAVRRAIEFNSMGNMRGTQIHGNQDAPASQVLAFPDAASAVAAAAAAMQMANNAVGGFTPILLAQINGGQQQQQQQQQQRQQQSTAPAMCIINPNIPYIWNPWSNSTIQAPPMPPNNFQLYDLNCPPQTAIADAVSNRTISLQMGPVTPDRSRTPRNSQYGEKAINLLADGVDQEEPQEESFPPGFSDATREEVAVDRDQVFSHHLASLNRVISTAVNSSQGLSQIFDSSSTVPSTPAKLNPSLLHGLDSSPAAVPTPAKENEGFFQTFDPSQTIPLTNAGEKQDFSELSHLLHAFLSSPPANKDNQDVSQPSKLPSASFSTPVQDNRCISHPLDSSPAVTPSVEENSEQNEREDQGLKQNATLQQKQKPPRRKKHRPKVVIEGKPKSTPKPKTPKQDARKENPSGKRKYVRRTGPKAPSTHPDADADAGQNINAAIAADTKSCKRALNFDSEVQTGKQHHTEIFQQGNPNGGTDSVASEAMAPTWNFSSDLSVGINSPGSKSTVQLAKGLEVVVEKSSAGIQIDLNRSFTEMLDESISLPEYLSPPATVKEPSNCNRNIDIEKMVQQFGDGGEAYQYIHTGKQQNSLQSPVNRYEQNSNINMQQVGSKREYNHIAHDAILHPMNILENHKQACQKIIENNKSYVNNSNYGMHFPGIYKRKRTSISHKEPAIKTPPSTTMSNGAGRTSAIAPNGVARPTACSMNGSMNSLLTLDTGMRSSLFQGNIMEEAESNSTNRYRGMHPINGEIYQTLHCMSRGVISWFNGPGVKQQDLDGVLDDFPIERRIKKKGNRSFHTRRLPSLYAAKTDPCSPQACVEALAADNQAKPQRKRRTKKAPPSNIAPHSGMSPHPQHQGTLTYDLCKHFIQKRATSFGQIPAGVGSPLQALIDEISQRLEYLNINGYSKTIPDQTQKALIPYVGGGVMVPYGGTKKRRPRAKVDLDAETERVWKLLMWQVNNNGTEGTDADKEKYWEEERQIFRGRVDSFIARMRLVQGDRRFSPWKGSVVDSVVGVFLTQNVSDHLSSSAFMALAARFPLQSRSKDTALNNEMRSTTSDESGYNIELDDDSKSQDKISGQQACNQVSLHGVEPLEEQEVANSNESFASNVGCGIANHSKGNHHASYMSGPAMCQESPVSRTGTATTVIESTNPVDAEDRKAFDDIISSQISVVSSQNSTESTPNAPDRIGSSSESNSEVENPVTEFKCDPFDSTTSFTELLEMLNVVCSSGHGGALSTENCEGTSGQLEGSEYNNGKSICGVDGLKDPYAFIERANSHHPQKQHAIDSILGIQSSSNQLHEDLNLGPTEVECIVVSKEESLSKSFVHKPSNSLAESCCVKHPLAHNNLPRERTEVQSGIDSLDHIAQRHNYRMQHNGPKLPSHLRDELSVAECSSLGNKGKATDRELAEPNAKIEGHSSKTASTEMTADTSKTKKGKGESSKKKDTDWDSLRRQTCCNGHKKERSSDRMDTLDWEAVRLAEVSEISNTIRARGMNNMLAERIKDFLNRLVREHGSIDLEWLRDVPPDKVKDFLLSIRGLGLKSVECVRLLTLHHLAFPVDTNVGRICVRLGWVPLQPLPESLQLHLLELYPMLETIQKYLWPRLCTLDQRTLYELHYQMITFGKVFCTKSKPNCNACPMRAECKHFASAFASAKLALPGPEEKRLASSTVPITVEQEPKVVIYPLPLPLPEGNPRSQDPKEYAHLQDAGNPQLQGPTNTSCEPIIEEPPSPEPARIELTETDIEDAVWEEDPEEIPEIKINMDVLTTNVQNILQQKNMELQEGDLSKALVALTPEAASIPAPKLKNAGRLRTEHTVYELPDSHPLLKGLDRREHDDPCSYLFAMWTPGETPQSTETPKSCGNSQPGNLCDNETCLSCNSIREANAQIVRGTLLIPCRTAMRGSFPLNGTYFQVNEVFADHDSSLKPIDVPRSWVWYLNTRTVYFGTSIPTIFKGLPTEDIQRCFWKGYVCVRGFDRKTRAPRPLIARLHIPASKLEKNKKTAGQE